MRHFDGGAIRDTEDGKLDFEGYLSPLVLEMYARYMQKHQTLPDGSKRGSDNWQGGMGLNVWMKSAWRHFFDLWALHRGHKQVAREDIEAAICGVLFNVMGYAHERLKCRIGPVVQRPIACNIPGCGCKALQIEPRNATEAL